MNPRKLLKQAVVIAAVAASLQTTRASEPNLDAIRAQIQRRHGESVRRIQEWIHQPSIAAEKRGMAEGCDLQIRLLRDAGFDKAERVNTDGQPGVGNWPVSD